jgi:hypothetical protein
VYVVVDGTRVVSTGLTHQLVEDGYDVFLFDPGRTDVDVPCRSSTSRPTGRDRRPHRGNDDRMDEPGGALARSGAFARQRRVQFRMGPITSPVRRECTYRTNGTGRLRET